METISNSWCPPAPIKAAFFDIDGTLCNLGTLELLPASAEAIERLRARGIRCFLATGRGPLDLNGLPMELFDGVAGFNGQHCTVADEVVHDLRFSRESLDALHELARFTDRAMIFQGLDDLCSVRRSINFFLIYAEAIDRFPLRDPSRIFEMAVYQSSIECFPGEEDMLAAMLPRCTVTRWNPKFVDIIPAGGGKGRGIAAMLAHLGISPAEAVAFGDSQNDASMFEVCGTGVAMGNGSAEAKAAASYVTDDITDSGLLNACIRLGIA